MLPKDAPLMVELGNAEMHLTSTDSDAPMRAVADWRQAVQVDPDNKDAWKNLLSVYLEYLTHIENQPKNDRNRPDLIKDFDMVRETSTQVSRLYPDDDSYAARRFYH